MTAGQLIIADLAVAAATAALWLGAGAAALTGRARPALGLLGAALLAALARIATVAALAAGGGWWLVQEKVLLGLPLLGAAAIAAAALAGPRLVRAVRQGKEAGPQPAAGLSLLAAGYAAAAGLGVTLLAGYPLTWSTALIAVALVLGAVIVTARYTAPAVPAARTGAVLTRRRFLGVAGGAAAAAGTAGAGLAFAPSEAVDTGGGVGGHSHGGGLSVADLRGADAPAAGGTTRRHALTARTQTLTLPSGRIVDAWTYDGQAPGPHIAAAEGDLVEVVLRNDDVADGVTIHWHGYDIACGEDGAPGLTQEAVGPGEEFTYSFRADQVGTYWYHTHQASHPGVRRGLYGTLAVTPRGAEEEGLDLVLPVHTFDGAAVLADTDEILEHAVAPGTPVRLRLVSTDSDPRRLSLAGTPFRVAAVDGRDLNAPQEVERVGLRLAAGARYDLTFTMPGEPVALLVDHDTAGGLRLRPEGGGAAGVPEPGGLGDTPGWPELDLLDYGEPADLPFDAGGPFDREFDLVLDRGIALAGGVPAYAQTVNGRAFPRVPAQLVEEGDLVLFTVVNRSFETHPWHLHGHTVYVLARDGRAPAGSPLALDTFDVRPGEVWQVAFRADNPGLWMNHCHNLAHAADGMMLQLHYAGITTPFGGAHAASH